MNMKKRILMMFVVFALVASMIPAIGASPPNDGSIIIHKFDKTGTDQGEPNDGQEITGKDLGTAIDGVSFRVTYVSDPGGTFSPIKTSELTVAKAKDIIAANSSLFTQTESTVSGEAKFENLEYGIYLVEELGGGGVTSVVDPFLVYVPLTLKGSGSADDTLLYEVHVYPKNQTLYINKEGDVDVANIDDTVTWTIEVGIPADIGSMTVPGSDYYRIEDTLDTRLTYDVGTAPAEVYYNVNGSRTTVPTADYTITHPTSTNNFKLTVDFNTTASAANLALQQTAGAFVEIVIKTTVNSTAAVDLSVPISNSAKLYYKNGNTDKTIEPPEPPSVEVSGLSVFKVDAEAPTVGLQGATFELWYSVDGASYTVIASATDTTDSDGLIYWKADTTTIIDGYYYVKEIKAPAGYQLQSSISPVIQLVSGTTEGGTWKLENVKLGGDFELPSTGGDGTRFYTIAGICLFAAAGTLFLISIPKKSKNK